MHATLSPSWKKSLLLVFVSAVAFATATPTTSRPQCFFQGLGNRSSATGVNADGTVVVGELLPFGPPPAQAFRWTAATGIVGLGLLPGFTPLRQTASGVNADGTSVQLRR
jgi:uncharacterized membrane protein